MASVALYCDEAGGLPAKDDDEVFVAAAVAFVAPTDFDFPADRRHSQAFAAKLLRKHHAYPSATYLRPGPGFARAWERKLKVFRFIADENKRLGRKLDWFRSADEVRPRNFIWLASMELAVSVALIPLVMETGASIDRLQIFLNGKTLEEGFQTFFRRFAALQVPRTLRSAFETSARNRAFNKVLRKRAEQAAWSVALPEDRVSVQWDTEAGYLGDPGGICLADCVASHSQAELRERNRKHGFFYELQAEGFRAGFPADITSKLLFLSRSSVQAWETETGVKVPIS